MPDVEFSDLLTQPVGLFDGVDIDNYIIATICCALKPKQVGITMAQFAAVEQSTGTWIKVPEETAEVRKNHIAKVLGCYEFPNWEYDVPKNVEERFHTMQIGFPKENLLNSDGDLNLPLLFTAVIGNISLGGKLKLMDIWFPKDVLAKLPGPQFGIEGIRKMLGVQGRPILNNMVKPCTGHTSKVAAELIYKAAVGGVDVIKDDELQADSKINTIEDRITLGMEAIDKANEEKGEKTIYFTNVTDNTPRIFKNIDIVKAHGGNGLLINYLPQGLPIIQQIAKENIAKMPIQMHMDFAGVWYEDPWTGITSKLTLGKLPRLVGGDCVVMPAPYGKAPVVPERFFQNLIECVYPLRNIKPMMPMPSGGITPGMVEMAISDCGWDIMIGSGGGIHSHPDGPTAGARGFRQAIDAAMKGIPVKDYAKDHEELAKAMGLWGQKKTGVH